MKTAIPLNGLVVLQIYGKFKNPIMTPACSSVTARLHSCFAWFVYYGCHGYLVDLSGSQPTAKLKTMIEMVGVERFELPALWSQTRCATRLRYTPTLLSYPYYRYFSSTLRF